MAEILLFHARKGNKAPRIEIFTDDERESFTLSAAMKQGWPFVVHIEFRGLEEPGRRRFMSDMEHLLKSHPEHPFVLNQMGQLNAAEVQRLIEAHGNIYFLTSHTNPIVNRQSVQPWINLFSGSEFKPAWRELFTRFPERFIFALDNVWGRHWRKTYQAQMEYWRKALAPLPRKVAHAVAHGNAERLWKLSPKPARP